MAASQESYVVKSGILPNFLAAMIGAGITALGLKLFFGTDTSYHKASIAMFCVGPVICCHGLYHLFLRPELLRVDPDGIRWKDIYKTMFIPRDSILSVRPFRKDLMLNALVFRLKDKALMGELTEKGKNPQVENPKDDPIHFLKLQSDEAPLWLAGVPRHPSTLAKIIVKMYGLDDRPSTGST